MMQEPRHTHEMSNWLGWITRIQAEWSANDRESGGEAGFAAIRVSFFFIRVGLEAFRWVHGWSLMNAPLNRDA